ncbi:MAG: ExeA family protein [Myxococcota bacterium]
MTAKRPPPPRTRSKADPDVAGASPAVAPPAAPTAAPETAAPPASEAADGDGRDAPFLFRDYVRARDLLLARIRRGPSYALVTGPSGAGKSSLRRDVEAALDRHRQQLVYLSSSKVTPVGFARFLALAVRRDPRRSHMETVADLAKTLRAQAAHLVVWVDEADQVPVDTLTELRILAECDQDAPQIFSLVLSGLPELLARLDAPGLAALRRRIDLRCALTGLARDELAPFLARRLGDGDARRIPSTVHDELFERTQGVPALVHKAAQAALDLAGERRVVTEEWLRAAFDAVGL